MNLYSDFQYVYPYGAASSQGKLKVYPEDFRVEEVLDVHFNDSGEHLYLFIEKSGITTDEASQIICQHYHLKPYHLGYCGLKDKESVSRQWFSLHLPGKVHYQPFEDSCPIKVLRHGIGTKKLKAGFHSANNFIIRIREFSYDTKRFQQQIDLLKAKGFANYFGQQRFGKKADNVKNAVNLFRQQKKINRRKKSIYLSAMRSYLFNRILNNRIKEDSWLQPLEGDAYMLDGSHSVFYADIDKEILGRFESMDIHTLVHLYGKGQRINHSHAAAKEDEVYRHYKEICEILENEGMVISKRPIRQSIEDFEFDVLDNQLQFKFTLPVGCYATTVIEHFCNIQNQ